MNTFPVEVLDPKNHYHIVEVNFFDTVLTTEKVTEGTWHCNLYDIKSHKTYFWFCFQEGQNFWLERSNKYNPIHSLVEFIRVCTYDGSFSMPWEIRTRKSLQKNYPSLCTPVRSQL